MAEAAAGNPITVSINAFNLTPKRIVGMDYIDFFSTEIHQRKENGGEAVFVFKFADALNMSTTLMGDAYDYGYVQSTGAHNLVKYWIARTYAFGHHHIAPYRQWVFVDGVQQTTTYSPPQSAEMRTIYDFIRQYSHLFDGYEPVEQYGLLYSHESRNDGNKSVYDVAEALYQTNATFGIIIAGNKWLEKTFTEEDLARYEKIFVPWGTKLDSIQSALFASWQQQGGTAVNYINWLLFEDEVAKLHPWVSLQDNLSVDVVPRIKPDDPEAPIVIHLVNRDINVSTNTPQEQDSMVVNVDSMLLEDRDISAVSYLHYGGPSIELLFETDTAGIHITVPSLKMWGVLVLGAKLLSTEGETEITLPVEFSLGQNYPNPFNPTTTIEYSLKEVSDVELVIYDIIGREVKTLVNGRQSAGKHRVRFSAGDLSSGVYHYRLKAGSYSNMKKMLVIK